MSNKIIRWQVRGWSSVPGFRRKFNSEKKSPSWAPGNLEHRDTSFALPALLLLWMINDEKRELFRPKCSFCKQWVKPLPGRLEAVVSSISNRRKQYNDPGCRTRSLVPPQGRLGTSYRIWGFWDSCFFRVGRRTALIPTSKVLPYSEERLSNIWSNHWLAWLGELNCFLLLL